MASLAISDPDELAMLVVQQFLRERGFEEALQCTERSTGVIYVDDKLSRGSLLMEMVYERIEKDLAASVSDMEIAEREEEEALIRGNTEDLPREDGMKEISGLHSQNILAITTWIQEGLTFTGAGDRLVRSIDIASSSLRWTCDVGSGAVLALALHPRPRDHPLLISTSMDGTVGLVQALEGRLLHSSKVHTKYAHRAAWTRSGKFFVTASHDATIRVFRLSEPSASEDTATLSFTEVWHVPFASTVEDVEPLKGDIIAVASRNDHCLRLLDLATKQEVERVNLNSQGDMHISFVAKHLEVSPCQRYLLVSTDGGRIIMMNTATWKQVRNFYGIPFEQFGNPCASFSPSLNYVIAAGAGGSLWVFHVGSAKVVREIKAHTVNVRGMEVDAGNGILATCSYDKTVKLWRCSAEHLARW